MGKSRGNKPPDETRRGGPKPKAARLVDRVPRDRRRLSTERADDQASGKIPSEARIAERRLSDLVRGEILPVAKREAAISEPLRFVGPTQRLIDGSFAALDFEEVTMRCFPLRAKMNRLEAFCDRYLNMDVPEEIARFKPAAPYVLMQVINYGRMSAATSNMGWVAQNEILFSVPLHGRWSQWQEDSSETTMVQDLATVAPFIFVDNEWSITTGREVYGWPKVPCRLEPGLNPWLRDPRQRRRLLTLKTLVIPELYAGRDAEYRPLVEIEQETAKVQMPPDVEYALNPLLRISKTMLASLNSTPDFLQMLTRMWIPGAPGEGRAPILSILGGLFRALRTRPPHLYGNTINLKQFRAPLPQAACYQALTNARMQIKRFNAGGLMGSSEFIRGDPSGGISILLHRQDAYPIVESLGLEVDSEFDKEGVSIAALRPVIPFWISLDLRYERARRICWRAERPKASDAERSVSIGALPVDETGAEKDSKADAGSGAAIGAAADSGWRRWQGAHIEAPEKPVTRDRLGVTETRLPSFNTTLGPVVSAVQGPFDFHDVTIRVLPLRASSESLREALPDPIVSSAGAGSHYRPVPAAEDGQRARADSVVFLVVTSYGRMSSAANDIGWWAQNEVGFAFVAKSEEIIGYDNTGVEAFVPPPETRVVHWLNWPFMFADSPIAVTEGREVLGLPTAYCRIQKGANRWLEPAGPEASDPLLRVSTLDLPAAGVGQEAEERKLFDVVRLSREATEERASAGGDSESLVESFLAQHWNRFSKGVRVRNLSVKEFRDEESPDKPCFQALVAFDRAIKKRKGRGEVDPDRKIQVKPMKGNYEVHIHGSATWRIVDTLGLDVARREEGPSGSDVSVCEVVDPFWMRVDVRAELPVDLVHRSVNSTWSYPAYLPFVYQELGFKDVFMKQMDAFERGLEREFESPHRKIRAEPVPKPSELSSQPGKTFAESADEILGPTFEARLSLGEVDLAASSSPMGQLSPQDRRRMKRLRREWTRDPSIWELADFDELIRNLDGSNPVGAAGARDDTEAPSEQPGPGEPPPREKDRSIVPTETPPEGGTWPEAAVLSRYAGKYRCGEGEDAFDLVVTRPFDRVGTDFRTRETDLSVSTTAPYERHFDPVVPSTVAHVFYDRNFTKRMTFRVGAGGKHADAVVFEEGKSLNAGAEPNKSWQGLRVSG